MNVWQTLLEQLREFGDADPGLVALVERLAAEDYADQEQLTGAELDSVLAGVVALGDNDEAGVGLLLAAADAAEQVRTAQVELQAAAEAEEAELEAARRRLRGEASDTPTEDEPAPEGDEAPEGEGEGGEPAAPEGEAPTEDAPDTRVPVTAGAGTRRPARRVLALNRTLSPEPAPADQDGAVITIAADVPDFQPGMEAPDLATVNRALLNRYGTFANRTQRRRARTAPKGKLAASRPEDLHYLTVASIHADYPEDRVLGQDPEHNGRIIGQVLRQATTPAAIAASGGNCAPLTPYYGVDILGDDRRPVWDALAKFQATRGGVISAVPPILPEVAGSAIQWTMDNDADPGSDGPETKPCLRVDCGDLRTTEMYAIPLCLEFGNINARTWGEWYDAWAELSLVGYARLADQLLLAAIRALSTEPAAVDTTVSGVVDLLVTMDLAATGYRSRHRLPRTFPFQAFLDETVLFLLRTDIARALPGGSFQENLTLAEGAIGAWFSSRNISVVWTPDLAPIGAQGAGDPLGQPDPSVDVPMFPMGTFSGLDGGRLDLGVVRDSGLNATNDFQTFVEGFEGVHQFGHEALWLTVNVCPGGGRSGTLDPAALCASYT